MRLQRAVVAAAGVSRRRADELILGGRVAVNGTVETSPGRRVDPQADRLTVDGTRHAVAADSGRRHYILFNKPRGMVSMMSDPEGRPCLRDVRGLPRCRLFPAGRLDFNTDGLIVLTNDGDFAQRIAHPRHGCRKTYRVKVRGVPSNAELDRLRAGVVLDGRRTGPAGISVLPGKVRNSRLQVVIGEGRKNQIRRMFDLIGHPVVKLTREAIGTVRARGIVPGEFRPLTAPEIRSLRRPRQGVGTGDRRRRRGTKRAGTAKRRRSD